jgi:hypothetical protein
MDMTLKRLLAGAVFAGAMLVGIEGISVEFWRPGISEAAAQPLPQVHRVPLGLHRSCARKIRATYRPAGCTRRCYPRNFYRQRMDYCVQSGGSV